MLLLRYPVCNHLKVKNKKLNKMAFNKRNLVTHINFSERTPSEDTCFWKQTELDC